jgi:hypothetical protein
MKIKYGRLITGIIALIGIAIGAYFWVNGMIDSLYAYRSPLHSSPPSSSQWPIQAPLTRRVVIILVDALRLDTSLNKQVMPYVSQLRSQGASMVMHSQAPSFSEPGYSTIFTGAWPYLSDGPAINQEYPDIPTWTQENLFSLAHQAGMKTAVSGYYWFEKLVPQEAVDYHFYTPGEDDAADQAVVAAAKPWLQDPSINLTLIHIDQVDYAGHHQGGPKSQAWNQAANRADQMIKDLAGKLDFSQDTLVILSDHGQIDIGGHGGTEDVVLTEPFIIVGKGITPGEYPDIDMVDVAPTLSELLGLQLPASSQGDPQVNIFSVKRMIMEPYDKQQLRLQTQLANDFAGKVHIQNFAKGKGAVETLRQILISQERVNRLIPSLILFLLPLLWIIWKRKNYTLPAVAASAVFVALYHIRFFLLDHLIYSFSIISTPIDLILYIGITSLSCMVIASILFHLIARKVPSRIYDRSYAQLYFVLILEYFLSIPVLFNFWMNGLAATWTLPRMDTYFTGMAFQVQMLSAALAGLLIIGFAALIGVVIIRTRKNKERLTPVS